MCGMMVVRECIDDEKVQQILLESPGRLHVSTIGKQEGLG